MTHKTHTRTQIASAIHCGAIGISMFGLKIRNAYAQVWQGGDVQSGISEAEAIETGGGGDIRESVTSILFEVVSYVGLAAVTVIIIAGIMLVVGGANSEIQSRARRIILYSLIGIVVMIVSAGIVKLLIDAGT